MPPGWPECGEIVSTGTSAAESFEQLLYGISADGNLGAGPIVEDHCICTVEPRFNGGYVFQIHQIAAVGPEKIESRQSLFQFRQGPFRTHRERIRMNFHGSTVANRILNRPRVQNDRFFSIIDQKFGTTEPSASRNRGGE